MQVAALGRAILDGLHSAGVLGVVKHIPGHGRALVDSHHELPVVEAGEEEFAVDLEPFERLRNAAMGMTSHLLYKQWDANRPASQSPIVIHDIIRQRIGFDGFLMSDDIGMEALAGDHGQRAAACVAAGCDVALHCDGSMDNMVLVAKAVPPLSQEAEARLVPRDGDDVHARRRHGFRGRGREAGRAARFGLARHGERAEASRDAVDCFVPHAPRNDESPFNAR